jgi:hypothetical protein
MIGFEKPSIIIPAVDALLPSKPVFDYDAGRLSPTAVEGLPIRPVFIWHKREVILPRETKGSKDFH